MFRIDCRTSVSVELLNMATLDFVGKVCGDSAGCMIALTNSEIREFQLWTRSDFRSLNAVYSHVLL